jgi:hypothetical protein
MSSKAPKKPPKPSPSVSSEAWTGGIAKYQPTKQEKAAIERLLQRNADSSPAPRVKIEQTGSSAMVSAIHANPMVGSMLISEALGTADSGFAGSILAQLGNAALRGGKTNEEDLNFLLSTIKEAKPNDHFETMLAAQMGVVHLSIMTFARRLSNVENIPQQDSAVNALTKLTRTFTAQLAAFKNYRSGGEQKVTVQHVNVADGGQAIVGNVTTQRSRASVPSSSGSSTEALTQTTQAPITMTELPEPIPVETPRKRKDGKRSSS